MPSPKRFTQSIARALVALCLGFAHRRAFAREVDHPSERLPFSCLRAFPRAERHLSPEPERSAAPRAIAVGHTAFPRYNAARQHGLAGILH